MSEMSTWYIFTFILKPGTYVSYVPGIRMLDVTCFTWPLRTAVRTACILCTPPVRMYVIYTAVLVRTRAYGSLTTRTYLFRKSELWGTCTV